MQLLSKFRRVRFVADEGRRGRWRPTKLLDFATALELDTVNGLRNDAKLK